MLYYTVVGAGAILIWLGWNYIVQPIREIRCEKPIFDAVIEHAQVSTLNVGFVLGANKT